MEEERNAGTDHKKNYESALKRLADGSDSFLFEHNRQLTIRFLRDAEAGKTVLKGQKKKIGVARLVKMYGLLKLMDSNWLKKPYDEVTEDDMMNFILALEKGVVLSSRGTPYTTETQATIKKFLRKFYKYLLGDNLIYPKLIQFVDTSTRIPEIRAISKEDTDRLIARSAKLIHKFALAVLFDSGMRVREFYNVKFADLTQENGGYKVRIRISKTRPRTINLPLYAEVIEEFLREHPERNNPESYVFNMTYGALKQFLWRLGRNLLGRNVYPHLFRHSSATYYSKYVTRYQLCYRYGWSASSKMPDRYIDMNGLIDDDVVSKVQKENGNEIQKKNEKLNDRLAIMQGQIQEMLKKQEEAEVREQIRKNESYIISELHNKKVGNSDEELLNFIDERPDILAALKLIKDKI
jgi:integrase